ncbi:copper homeostasis protein CutC [Virgibacillus massiliensis]|nr:copper homeostasis protein CutC [Virgibacillus massiliensis]
MMLEVIVQNGEEAIHAENFGANRLELVTAISEGGLTPSYGTIKHVLKNVSIPVQIMIRPHSYHFNYTSSDLEIIIEDIRQLAKLGGLRIVFGAVTADYKINTAILDQIIQAAPNIDITFHRAFDEVEDQVNAYYTLTQYKQHVKRILTSGGKENCQAGQNNLESLVNLANQLQGPEIMPGGGLTPSNLEPIHKQVQAGQYHFGRSLRIKGDFKHSFDPLNFKKVVNVLNSSYKQERN